MDREDHFNMWSETQHALGYTQGIKAGPTVYLSGTAALDEKFQTVAPGDLGAQMRYVYERIAESLAHWGLDFRHVVRENMYVTSIDELLPHMAYRKGMYGDGPFPTSTTVEVQKLFAPGLMIEIEVTAVEA
ncbi:RidA family protein [Lentzea sp. NPDC051213]|uniref:RidA family protein n=1 Tax=Lentzea sp. NPDC051213 TaxID=3364126 RepID=UPI0037BB40D5